MLRDYGRKYYPDDGDVKIASVHETTVFVDGDVFGECIFTIQGAEGFVHLDSEESVAVARAILKHFGRDG